MNLDFFKRKRDPLALQAEWNTKGEKYATEINEMIEYGERVGWDNWKGKPPEDKRDHLAADVIRLLKKANEEGTVEEFRKNFPPAHAPFINYFEAQGQSIGQMHFIHDEKIVFLTGTPYQKRQAYLLDGDQTIPLESTIESIGKSKQNDVFAVLDKGKIVTTQGWEGDIIESFDLQETKGLGVTELIPFNDGKRILLVTAEGIYLISKDKEIMVHPVPDLADEEWDQSIDMENATLSHDNQYIIVGDQCSDHRILNAEGMQVGEIGPQSSYPHFCLFSKDDSQLITNSCHFYNGLTIGVSSKQLVGIKIEAYEESDLYQVIDDGMRVYVGLATQEHYILGDAYGNIRAISSEGKCIWSHFLGSTIGGLAISDDEQTLWVGSCTGMIHKLRLGQGHRDTHTIGNGNHFEEFRIILWKGESPMIW